MFARHAAALLSATGTGALLARPALCDDDKDGKSASQSFFDADALERGAKAVREIDRSSNAKAVRLPSPSAALERCAAAARLNCVVITVTCMHARARARTLPRARVLVLPTTRQVATASPPAHIPHSTRVGHANTYKLAAHIT